MADPDGLLLEEGILEGIRKRGFELIPFEDHIAVPMGQAALSEHTHRSAFRSGL